MYGDRRRRVLEALGSDAMGEPAALVLAAGPELHIGGDTALRYVPDADLYWLTGYAEPSAVLVLAPAADTPFTLFVRDRDPEQERWTGVRGGVDSARQQHGADAAFPVERLAEKLPGLLAGAARVYARVRSGRQDVDEVVLDALASGLRSRPRTGRGPHTITDPAVLLAPMRRVKDAHEIELMRRACAISAAGFRAAHEALAAGAGTEWEVEAALEHAFRSQGASGPAFPSIVAGGANATVLHYIRNDAPLEPESLLLIDAGARFNMYCGDISRTYAVGGAMAPAQRAVHEVVTRAHGAGIAAAVPGRTIGAVHDAALGVLVDGLVELGLLVGDRDALIRTKEYRRYFPHRTSHWLGLDVHDVGDYVAGPVQEDDAQGSTVLEAGMVFTVEPGLYLPMDDDSVPPEFRGIGVRIEDDVLITADGHEILTADAPA